MKKALPWIPWILVLLFLVGCYFLDALMFQFGWNAIAPKLGSFNHINYWLAFAVSVFIDTITVKVSTKAEKTDSPLELFSQLVVLLVIKGAFTGIIALLALGF